MTTLDMTGTFVMNKKLSDDTDEILRLQGISWFTRSVISAATITLHVKHYKDDEGIEHIDIKQEAKAWVTMTSEELRTLNWESKESSDSLFGPVVGKSRRAQLNDIEGDSWMREGWLPDVEEHGAVHTIAASDTPKSGKTWSADAVWGFADIDGERRYSRRVFFTGPGGEIIKARLVYDYSGPNVS